MRKAMPAGEGRRQREEIGPRIGQTVGRRLARLQIGHECGGLRIVEIQHDGLCLDAEAPEQATQFVQRFMVERDVVHDRDTRLKKRNRAVAFVHFAHECPALADPGAGER